MTSQDTRLAHEAFRLGRDAGEETGTRSFRHPLTDAIADAIVAGRFDTLTATCGADDSCAYVGEARDAYVSGYWCGWRVAAVDALDRDRPAYNVVREALAFFAR